MTDPDRDRTPTSRADGRGADRGGAGDLALVEAALRGDPVAVDRFLERMKCVPRMLAAKNRRLGARLDQTELEDLTQETLMAVWRKLPQYNGAARLETWVFRFCFLELLKRLRRRRDRDEEADRALSPADELRESGRAETGIDFERVHLSLERLDDDEAEVIRLKHFCGLTFEEAGGRLGISSNTVKTRYYRGLRKLRGMLAETTLEERRRRNA